MPSEKTAINCDSCSSMWKVNDATNCWSLTGKQVPQPPDCPAKVYSEIIDKAFDEYSGNSQVAQISKAATKTEGLCYYRDENGKAKAPRWTRVESTIAFAKIMGYKKIGIASCISLLMETKQLSLIFEKQGFELSIVTCKAGSIDKSKMGFGECCKINPGTHEPICNPIAQARIFNKQKTDMNIILGLCVGHDMLFSMHSKAPVTTLVVKDRVTGHNPVVVLHGQNYHYKRLQNEPVLDEKELIYQESVITEES